jgi:pilus assembly protein CpaB
MAMIAGGAALVILYYLINSYQDRINQARAPEDTVMVIVAARDLYQGVTITEEDLYAVEIPPRYLPEGVFLSPEHVVGRIPRERILANEFVRANRLADPESGVGLNAVIPRGMRAMSIAIKDGEALSGFLNPLNYVDVLVTVRPDDRSAGFVVPETRTLLQAVFVLGVNSRMQKESKEEARQRRGSHSPSVTLLVTADQAEELAHAEKMGRLRLSLRNDLDVNYADLTGVDVNSLMRRIQEASPTTIVRRRIAKAEVKTGSVLKMIKGSEVSTKELDADGTLETDERMRRR